MNIKEYLSSKEISYKEKGKNIGKDFISITCPMCFDSQNHFGISLIKPFYNCWICGEKGHISRLIQKIEKCSYLKAKKIANQLYPDSFTEEGQEEIIVEPTRFNNLYSQFSERIPREHREYLESRGFDVDQLKSKYKIVTCDELPRRYRKRIVAPIIINNEIVNFVARDITGEAVTKYFFCPDKISLQKKRKILYNVDECKKKVIVVEGVTDVWKIGGSCVATLTTNWTMEQVYELSNRGIEQIFVIYDSEPKAQKKAQKLVDVLSMTGNFKHVERIELEGIGDPGELSEQEARYLRKILL